MEWTKYTTKTALKDNDELMILDKDANANKRTLMDKIWDYVVDKMTTAVIAKLGTTNKTLIGAVNELNSNTQSGTTGGVEIAANSMQTVDVIFKKPFNAIPTIVCTLKSGSNITTYGDLTAFVDYGSVTKKGFTIKVSNSCATLGAKPCVSWIATVL